MKVKVSSVQLLGKYKRNVLLGTVTQRALIYQLSNLDLFEWLQTVQNVVLSPYEGSYNQSL